MSGWQGQDSRLLAGLRALSRTKTGEQLLGVPQLQLDLDLLPEAPLLIQQPHLLRPEQV
jgi:hypothetical protein